MILNSKLIIGKEAFTICIYCQGELKYFLEMYLGQSERLNHILGIIKCI